MADTSTVQAPYHEPPTTADNIIGCSVFAAVLIALFAIQHWRSRRAGRVSFVQSLFALPRRRSNVTDSPSTHANT